MVRPDGSPIEVQDLTHLVRVDHRFEASGLRIAGLRLVHIERGSNDEWDYEFSAKVESLRRGGEWPEGEARLVSIDAGGLVIDSDYLDLVSTLDDHIKGLLCTNGYLRSEPMEMQLVWIPE